MARLTREPMVARLDGTDWLVVIHPAQPDGWRAEAVSPEPKRTVTKVNGEFRSHGAALREGLRLAESLRRERAS